MRAKPTIPTPLVCRDCGRTPAERGDQVSAGAAGYLCSRCLMRPLVPRNEGGRYRDSGSPPEGKSGPTNPGTSDTVLRDIATGRAFRPGRPSLALAERRARARERKRRQRGIAGLLCPVGR